MTAVNWWIVNVNDSYWYVITVWKNDIIMMVTSQSAWPDSIRRTRHTFCLEMSILFVLPYTSPLSLFLFHSFILSVCSAVVARAANRPLDTESFRIWKLNDASYSELIRGALCSVFLTINKRAIFIIMTVKFRSRTIKFQLNDEVVLFKRKLPCDSA